MANFLVMALKHSYANPSNGTLDSLTCSPHPPDGESGRQLEGAAHGAANEVWDGAMAVAVSNSAWDRIGAARSDCFQGAPFAIAFALSCPIPNEI